MRTVLLDLDGTLADSAALIVEHLAAALESVGAAVPGPARLRALVGPPFETALPELGLSAEQTSAAITAYRAGYDPVAADRTPLYPGVPALLDRLAPLRLAVATSKPERLARRIVAAAGISHHFAVVAGADHVAGRVGKAAVVRSVLDRLGLDPTTQPVVMVGDRHHDVDGAAAHGVPTIGVGWGYADPADPDELAGARLVVADLDELITALEGDQVWSVSTLPA